MRKYTAVIITVLFIFISHCSKGEELKYNKLTSGSWIAADVNMGKTRVLYFQVFDRKGESDKLKAEFKKSVKIFNKYPAIISNDTYIYTAINDRFQIRLVAYGKAYRNTAKLKNFLEKFDLKGLEKVKGVKLMGRELKKYIPKL